MNFPEGFQFQSSQCRIVSRPGALDDLTAEAESIGVKRLMLISGTRSGAGSASRATRAALGALIVCEYTGVPQHSGVAAVQAIAQMQWGLSPWVALPLAMAFAAAVGAFVGAASFRYGLKGSYF
eukprot:gene17607-23908_t